MRETLSGCLVSFLVIFGLNGLFHTHLASQLYDRHLQGVMTPIAQANPVPIALTDVILVSVMAFFLLSRRVQPPQLSDGARVGAMVGLVGSATYNLVNSAMIESWPLVAMVIDITWHVVLGALGGALMAWIYVFAARKMKHGAA